MTKLHVADISEKLVVIPTGRSHSNHAEVTRALGIGIIAARHNEGMTLPGDAELTARFGVSRTVLRESVKTLVAKGLLTTKAKVGTRVRERSAWNMFDPDVLAWHLDAGVDKRFLRDLADIRLAVEPRAAELAAQRRPAAMLPALHASIDRMRASLSDSDDFADADLRLHLDIATASGNPFMRSIGAVIEAALRASFVLSAPVEDAERERSIAAHADIVAAIECRNPDAAAAAMIRVIHNGLHRHGAAEDSNGSNP